MRRALYTLSLLLFASSILIAEVSFSSPLKGRELDMGNLLVWETNYESDIDFFIVERSSDGIDFDEIGTVEAVGYSKEEKKYRFLDAGLGTAKDYYRLKIVDIDGTSNFSQIIFINKAKVNRFGVVSYSSTLVESGFEVALDAISEGDLIYEVVSYQGMLILNEQHHIYPGINEIQLDLEHLASGIYKIKFYLDGEEEELVIQKKGDEKYNFASKQKIKNKN